MSDRPAERLQLLLIEWLLVVSQGSVLMPNLKFLIIFSFIDGTPTQFWKMHKCYKNFLN